MEDGFSLGSIVPVGSTVLGKLTGLAGDGAAHVTFAGATGQHTMSARSIVDLELHFVGRDVVLFFADETWHDPIILGVVHGARPGEKPDVESTRVSVISDGERLTLSAAREIELKCGQASLTLTRAGKIVVRGTNLLSRATGVNRIFAKSVLT